MNQAVNSTLGRTLNTAGTTLITLIAIFMFGGPSIRGFVFALLFGIAFGTYSSIFVASSLVYDLQNWHDKRLAKKQKLTA
jgi:SecD/SecF fusion protein